LERTGINVKTIIRPTTCRDRGSAGIGALLLFAVTIAAFLLVCEFFYAFNVKQGVEIELTRAVNTAVNLAMSDAHRQDRLLELDAGAAYDSFHEYLHYDMKLSSSFEARSAKGDLLYTLELENVIINPSPPGMRVSAYVTARSLFFGKIAPAPLRFLVRCSSVNRRIEQ